MFLLIPTFEVTDGQVDLVIGSRDDAGAARITDPLVAAKLWRIQNARLINIDCQKDVTDRTLEILHAISEKVDIPVLATTNSTTETGTIGKILETGVRRVYLSTDPTSPEDFEGSVTSTFGKSRITIQYCVAGNTADAVSVINERARTFDPAKLILSGDNEHQLVEAVNRLAELNPKVRLLIRCDVETFEALSAIALSKAAGLIAGEKLYHNPLPCQNFWCWNSLDSVDLEHYSTAKLC